jgi:hypothetical protein
MKILLEINENKVEFVLELLRNFKFVKAHPIEEDTTQEKTISENIKAGLEEVRLFKKGKLKTTPAKDFLNEL